MTNVGKLVQVSSQIRRDIVRMVADAKSGHPGGSLSSTDYLTTLFFETLNHDPKTWTRDGKDSDVFILSAGHLTPVYYSVLARAGYFPVSELGTFRKYGSRLQGHPSVAKDLPGIHQASGSLGQGLSAAAGIAIGKKLDKEENFVYTLLGDGETQEGQIWEAAIFAVHHKLDNLIAATDWNRQQIDGTIDEVASLGDLEVKWSAFGWNVITCNGHDHEEIANALEKAKSNKGSGKPSMILLKTEMGQGVDFMVGTNKWHGAAPSAAQCEQALSQLEETLGDY